MTRSFTDKSLSFTLACRAAASFALLAVHASCAHNSTALFDRTNWMSQVGDIVLHKDANSGLGPVAHYYTIAQVVDEIANERSLEAVERISKVYNMALKYHVEAIVATVGAQYGYSSTKHGREVSSFLEGTIVNIMLPYFNAYTQRL